MAEKHSFNVMFAQAYGIEESLIFDDIYFWCLHNKQNKQNKFVSEKENEETRKERYWTYNTCEAFSERYVYLNKTKIYRVLKELEDKGLIISDEFNKLHFDRTKWYAVTEFGESEYLRCNSEINSSLYQCDTSNLQNEKSEFCKMKNEKLQNETTIPTSLTTTKTTSLNSSEETIAKLEATISDLQKQLNSKTSKKSKKKGMTEEDINEYWSKYSSDTRKRYEDVYRKMYKKAKELDPKYVRSKIQCLQNVIKIFEYAKNNERDITEIERAAEFGLNDSFWAGIITSPEGFIRNFEKVISKANSSNVSIRKGQSAFIDKQRDFSDTSDKW